MRQAPTRRHLSEAFAATAFLRRGLRIVRVDPVAYLLAVLVFATPSFIAGVLAATLPEPAVWRQVLIASLPWITVVFGAAVVMVLVGKHAHQKRPGFVHAIWLALSWTPRYLWTNTHTSLIFWLPTTVLIELRAWSVAALPQDASITIFIGAIWWLAIAAAAVLVHTRTLLAPFFAVHGDLPGTLATLEAWRLSGRHFRLCLSTLVVGSLPVALPLGLLALAGFLVLQAFGAKAETLLAVAPHAVWIGMQAIRPVLIPAVYALYGDLWSAEQERREREGPPPIPRAARALLALTRPLPRLGRWK